MLEYETSKAYDKASLRAEFSTDNQGSEANIEFFSPWYSGSITPAYPTQDSKLRQ